jgi:hypothetical protein
VHEHGRLRPAVASLTAARWRGWSDIAIESTTAIVSDYRQTP